MGVWLAQLFALGATHRNLASRAKILGTAVERYYLNEIPCGSNSIQIPGLTSGTTFASDGKPLARRQLPMTDEAHDVGYCHKTRE